MGFRSGLKLIPFIVAVVALAGGVAPAQAAVNDCLHRGGDPFDSGAYSGRNGLVRTYPGYPCAPFTNRARVIRRVRQLLLYNGYRQAGMKAYAPPANWRTGKFGTGSDRQIVMVGIQDGYLNRITVVKMGRRQIAVLAEPASEGHYGGGGLRVNLRFTA
jgi:hypothetical protein